MRERAISVQNSSPLIPKHVNPSIMLVQCALRVHETLICVHICVNTCFKELLVDIGIVSSVDLSVASCARTVPLSSNV